MGTAELPIINLFARLKMQCSFVDCCITSIVCGWLLPVKHADSVKQKMEQFIDYNVVIDVCCEACAEFHIKNVTDRIGFYQAV